MLPGKLQQRVGQNQFRSLDSNLAVFAIDQSDPALTRIRLSPHQTDLALLTRALSGGPHAGILLIVIDMNDAIG